MGCVCALACMLLPATAMGAEAKPTISQPTNCADATGRFRDVTVGTPHKDDITWLACTNITTGFPDGTFKGMSSIVRQDMAAFLHRMAKLRGIKGADTYKPSAADWKRFKDVNPNTPHAESVLWLASTGITEGYPDGTFKGMTPIYRQDMAAFLHRFNQLEGTILDTEQAVRFTDVTGKTPHHEHIAWLASTNITTGYRNANGTYRYEGMTPVYRQDMAAFLHRLETASGCRQVTPAPTKQVLVTPERTEQVLVTPETTEKVLVTPERTVQHPAITHEEPVYEEQLESMGRWDDGYTIPLTEYWNMSDDEREAFYDIHGSHHTTWDEWQQVQVGTQTIVDTPAWTETIPAEYKTVTHPAEYETVTHPAVYETVPVGDATISACPAR